MGWISANDGSVKEVEEVVSREDAWVSYLQAQSFAIEKVEGQKVNLSQYGEGIQVWTVSYLKRENGKVFGRINRPDGQWEFTQVVREENGEMWNPKDTWILASIHVGTDAFQAYIQGIRIDRKVRPWVIGRVEMGGRFFPVRQRDDEEWELDESRQVQ